MTTVAPTPDMFERRSPGQLLAVGMGVVASTYLIAFALMQWIDHARTVEILANLLGLIGLTVLYVRTQGAPLGPTLRLHVVPPSQAFWLLLAAVAVLPPLVAIGEWSQRILPAPIEYLEAIEEILPKDARDWWVTILSIVVIAPLGEELVFRGLVQQAARRITGGVGAAVLTGTLFGIWHGQPWNLANLVILGVFLGFVFEATGSVLACVVLHGTYNLCVLLLYVHGRDLPGLEGPAGAFVATASLAVAWAAYGRLRRIRAWEDDPLPVAPDDAHGDDRDDGPDDGDDR